MEKVYSKFFTASLKEDLTSKEVEEVIALYETEGYDTVLAKAKKEKMLPFVASMMCRLHKDEQRWRESYLYFKERNTKIISELDRVYKAMDMAEVKKLFLSENLGALLCSERDIALFASGDADNCSDFSEKEKIYRVMSTLGYIHEECMTGRRVGMTIFSNDNVMPDGFHINICWGALYREKQPDLFLIDDIEGWDNMRKYKDTSISLPSTDTLLYICLLHISLHSYNRKPGIRLYEDIYNITYPNNVEWSNLIKWADCNGTKTRLVTSAMISNLLLGVAVPDSIIISSKNRVVRRLIDLVSYGGFLKKEPSKLKVLMIEILSYCTPSNFCNGMLRLLGPSKQWLVSSYGKNVFLSYINYITRLF